MVTGTKRLKFPEPGATKEKEQITQIGPDRMLAHWNQDHPTSKPAQRITKKIINHTAELAKAAGWAGATCAKDAVTGHTAGLVLLRQKKTTITPDAGDVVDAVEIKRRPIKSIAG